MKQLIKRFVIAVAILTAFIVPLKAFATPSDADQLIALGMNPAIAKKLVAVVNTLASPFNNNTWVTVRNAANSANIDVLKVDGSDETWLNADTGDMLKLGIAGTAEATLGDDSLTFSGATFSFIPGATALAFKNNANNQTNLNITDAGVATVRAGLTVTAGNIAATNGNLTFGTALKGVINDIGTLAGAGTTISDAAAIAHIVTRVTGANGTVGVKLPALAGVTAGTEFQVINSDVTNALKIYSNAAGELITGQAGNTAISLAAKLILRCWAYDATNWYCEKGVLPY